MSDGGSITGGSGVLTGTSFAMEDGSVSAVLGGTGAAMTKTTDGMVTLSGTNTFTGATTVSAGVLNLRNSSALGATTSGISVASGAALELQGGIAIGAEALTLNGSGINGGGSLRNISGDNSYGGAISFGAAATIASDADILTISGALSGNFEKTFFTASAASISASGSIGGSGGVVKTGAGELVFTGINTFTGPTEINAGTVTIATDRGLGSAPGSATSGQIVFNGGALATTADFSLSSNRGITLGADGGTFNIANNTSVNYAGIIAGSGAFNVSGGGRLVLAGSNSFTGPTVIQGGTIQLASGGSLGSSNVTVSANGLSGTSAALDLNGVSATIGSLTLGGPTGSGGLTTPKTNTVQTGVGTLTLGGDVTFNGDQGSQSSNSISGNLALGAASRTFTVNGAGSTLAVFANLTGTTGFTKAGVGTLALSGTNSLGAGVTTLSAGTLALGSASALAGSGNLTFTGGTLRYDASGVSDLSGRIKNSGSSVAVNTNGQDVTFASAIDSSNSGGLTKTGSGTLTLGAVNAYTGITTINGGTLSISGSSGLGASSTSLSLAADGTLLSTGGTYALGTSRTVTLTGPGVIEAAAGALTVDGTISNGGHLLSAGGVGAVTLSGVISGAGGLSKFGSGTLTLSGANEFSGVVAIDAGVVRVTHSNGLGAENTGAAVVASGAALELQGGIAVNLPITLNGSGISNGGALRNISGNNSMAGVFTLASATRINSDADTLTINNIISGSGTNLTVGGAGTTRIGALQIGTAATITKDGSGALTLGGVSDHKDTTISSGQLNINDVLALGSVTGGSLTLASGVTIDNTSAAAIFVDVPRAINLGSSLTFAGTRDLNLGSGTVTLGAPISGFTTITVNGAGKTLALDGQITGSSGITKEGPGILSLGYGGTYALTGVIDVNAGELYLTNAGVGFTSVLHAHTGGTVRLAPGVNLPDGKVVINGGQYLTSSLTTGNVEFNVQTGDRTTTLTSNSLQWDGKMTVKAGNILVNPGNEDWIGYTPSTVVADRLVFENGAKLVSTDGFVIESTKGIQLDSGTVTFESDANDLMIHAVIAGAGGLTKTGAAHLHLEGANTYVGGTRVESGLVGILSDNNLGTGGLTLAGGVLEAGYSAALTPTTVTIADTRSFQLETGTTSGLVAQVNTTLAYSGILGETGTSGAANLEVGAPGLAGTVALTGANSFTGVTRIHNGATLSIDDLANGGTASGIGASSSAAANLVLHGGTLQYTGAAVTTDRLFSVGTEGGIIDSSGAGAITFSATGTMGFNGESGTRTLTFTGTTGGSVAVLLADNVNPTSLVKAGSGTWTLSGTNTYTGGTLLQAGMLNISASANLGSGGLDFNGGSLETTAALSLTSGVTLTSAGTIFTNHPSGIATALAGTLTGSGALAKTGSGTLELTGTGNSQSGAIAVSAGRLNAQSLGSLGSGPVSLSSGTTLGLTYNSTAAVYELASAISDATPGAAGEVIRSGSGTVALTGTAPNTYTGLTTVTSGTLRLNKTSSVGSPVLAFGGNALVNGGALVFRDSEQISDTATVTVSSGTFEFAPTVAPGRTETIDSLIQSGGAARTNGNTFKMGTFTLSGGTASVNSASDGTPGTFEIVAGGSGLTFSGNDSPTLTLNSVATGIANRLVLGANVSSSGNGTALIASSGALAIAGAVDLGSSSRTFTVGDGSAATDLWISANLSNGGLVKSGGGTMVLSASNEFAGATVVDGGVLNLQHGLALGATTAGTTVNTGAALELQGDIAVGEESLSLAGTGIGGSGALRSLSGGNSFGGAISLSAAARIQADAGTLTLGGGVAGNAYGLTIGGAGHVMATAPITTSSNLTKDGTGTLSLTGSSTHSAVSVAVSSGTLVVGVAGSGSLTAPTVTVATGATLGGSGTITGNVSVAGTMAPGNSPGVLSIVGDYEQTGVFQWELNALPDDATLGVYDRVIATGNFTGSNAVFQVVLLGNSFTDAFWDAPKTWGNVFTAANLFDLGSIFTSYSGSGVNSDGTVTDEGHFTLSGSNLTWTAVPEPTGAISALLLAVGMLRRRRTTGGRQRRH